MEQTLYEILGVAQDATLKEIKMAYRKRTMEYHPDNNPNANNQSCHEMMYRINQAYSILRNPDFRMLYDEKLYEKSKSDISNENGTSPTAAQKTPENKEQPKNYKRTYESNPEQYNYYNEIDFDESMQEEFIEWLLDFSNSYENMVHTFYVNLNTTDDFVFQKFAVLRNIYDSFGDIIDYEKK